MASESAEEGSLTISLGPELEDWLDARARDLDVDRETVLVRLLSSHRDAASLDDAEDGRLAATVAEAAPVQEAVASAAEAAAADALDERLPDGSAAGGPDHADALAGVVREQVELALEERLREEVEDVVASVLEAQLAATVQSEVEDAVESALSDRDDGGADLTDLEEGVEAARQDFAEKLEDVRERVLQVKRETDRKAPADHTHEELARVDAIGGRLADVEESVTAVESDVAALEAEVEAIEADAGDDGLDETVAEIQDRLKTVAWVVSDLREAHESTNGSATLERLKQSAAAVDTARAVCERCGEGVEVALLTRPECPHCEATVTEVEPGGRFFGKPRLLAASQLESGDQR